MIIILVLAISVIGYILYQLFKVTKPLPKPIPPDEIRKNSVMKKYIVDSSKKNYVRPSTSRSKSHVPTRRDDDFSIGTFQHSIQDSSQDYSSGHSHHLSNDHGGGGDFGGGGSSDSWGSADSSSSSDSGSSYSSND